jgi:hypothetical protein
MPDTTVGPDATINLRNQVAKSKDQKSMRYHRDTNIYPKAAPNDIIRNQVAKSKNQKLMRYHRDTYIYPKAAPNDIIVSIAVTHMERRIGKDVCLT